jgi:hypothetical protein
MILLDTHALLWWALDPGKLSATAATQISEMEVHGGFASAISIWELGIKIQRGKLELGISIEELARRIDKTGCRSAARGGYGDLAAKPGASLGAPRPCRSRHRGNRAHPASPARDRGCRDPPVLRRRMHLVTSISEAAMSSGRERLARMLASFLDAPLAR